MSPGDDDDDDDDNDGDDEYHHYLLQVSEEDLDVWLPGHGGCAVKINQFVDGGEGLIGPQVVSTLRITHDLEMLAVIAMSGDHKAHTASTHHKYLHTPETRTLSLL